MNRLLFIWVLVVVSSATYAQKLDTKAVNLTLSGTHNIESITDYLEEYHDINLVYNASLLDGKKQVSVPTNSSLKLVLDGICREHNLQFSVVDNRILFRPMIKEVRVQGRIFDSESGEYLSSVIVEDMDSDAYTFTNDYGFFSLSIPPDHRVHVSHIGYKSDTLEKKDFDSKVFYLKSNLTLQLVLIAESNDGKDDINTSSRLLSSDTWSMIESEILNNSIDDVIRKQSSVHSGSEGQTGFFVRGGTPDQNLILIDNMHIYEASHTFGLNSIFVKKSLKQIELNAEGMPARYGDRISAVLNATLKAGDKEKFGGSLSASLDELLFQVDGPLLQNGKTTINLAGRKSLHSLYISPILKKFTRYKKGVIDYFDFFGKVNHRFSNTSSASLTVYTGGDLFSLDRLERIEQEFKSYEVDIRSKLKWNNRLVSFNYDNVITDKMHLHVDAGYLDYGQISTGYYSYKTVGEVPDDYQTIVYSGNEDNKVSTYLDYYIDDEHRLKIGGEYLIQRMNPALFQIDSLLPDEIVNSDRKKYTSRSLSLYAEDTYTPSSVFTLYGGLRYTRYKNAGVHEGWQPRLKAQYTPWKERLILKASYSYNVQFSHLLVNTGLGLPSDLWVPSTKDIAPQRSHNLDLSMRFNATSTLNFDVSYFSKRLSNVIEYQEEVNIYLIDFLSNPRGFDFSLDNRWEEYVLQGKGRASGVSFGMDYLSDKLAFWLQYTYARDKRTFDKLNNGEEFRYRYDRPHDINLGLWWKINPRWSLTSRFVYTSGNTFSLALEEYDSFLGIILSSSDKRNNYRMPAYHRLDVSAKYSRALRNGKQLDVIFGVNNIYNQRNPHYIYIYSDPIDNSNSLRKVSLFPILPKMKVSYTF